MEPVSILYDEYIDRPKLSEPKKAHLVNSSSPRTWVGIITDFFSIKFLSFNCIKQIINFNEWEWRNAWHAASKNEIEITLKILFCFFLSPNSLIIKNVQIYKFRS